MSRHGAKTTLLSRVREHAAGCCRCDLWKRVAQTVFGDGPTKVRLILVGEQPGGQDDRAGKPFVGPAGRWLRQFLPSTLAPLVSLYRASCEHPTQPRELKHVNSLDPI